MQPVVELVDRQPLWAVAVALLLAVLPGCTTHDAAGLGCGPEWKPTLAFGSHARYVLSDVTLDVVVDGPTVIFDGLGPSRIVAQVDATWTYADAVTQERHYVDPDTRLVLRSDRQEAAEGPWVERYLQPTPDSMLFDALWGSAPYLLGPWLSNAQQLDHAGWNMTTAWSRPSHGVRLNIEFEQANGPVDPPMQRSTWIEYECDNPYWPVRFDSLVGLGNGFDQAELTSWRPGSPVIPFGKDSWTAWALHEDARPADGQLGPTLSHETLVGSLEQAVSAARLAPIFLTQWSLEHPNAFPAAAYYEPLDVGHTWTIQFADVVGDEPYQVEVQRHDVTLLATGTSQAPILTVVSEAPSRNPIIAEFPARYRGAHGYADLSHALEAALPEVGDDYAIAISFELEALRWPSANEIVMHVYSRETGIIQTYSGVNGQLLRAGTLS